MPHKYEYTGDGTHTFPTIGKQPEPGEQIVSDHPLNSPFLKEIVQVAGGGTTVAADSSNAQEAAVQPQHTEEPSLASEAAQQIDIEATEDAHQEGDAHTEGADE